MNVRQMHKIHCASKKTLARSKIANFDFPRKQITTTELTGNLKSEYLKKREESQGFLRGFFGV